MTKLITKFLNDESGATAIEYGLIAALLCVGIAAAMTSLKTQVVATFNSAGTAMTTANQ